MVADGPARERQHPTGTDAGRRGPPWHVTDRQISATPRHLQADELLAYWRTKAPPDGLPRRVDIVAAEIPRLLPSLCIAEPVDDGGDWRFRLVGTSLAMRYNFDWTGRRVSELSQRDVADSIIALFHRLAQERAPGFVTASVRVPSNPHMLVYEAAVLPIIGRDGSTVWMLAGLFFFN